MRTMTVRDLCALVLLVAAVSGCISNESGRAHQSDEVLHLEGLTEEPNQLVGFFLVDRRGTAPGSEPPAPGTLIRNPPRGPIVPIRTPLLVESTSRRRWSADIPVESISTDAWILQDPAARALATSAGRLEIAAFAVNISGGIVAPIGESLRTRTGAIADDFSVDGTWVGFDNDGVGLHAPPVAAWEGIRAPVGTAGIEIEFGSYDVPGVEHPVFG